MAQTTPNDQPAGFKNHVENIAIIGAGGTIGSHIAEALIAQGKHRITALSRPSSRTPLPSGLHTTKQVDYTNEAALVSALRGEDALIITLPAGGGGPELQQTIIRAAVAARVKYIMPNEWGSDHSNAALAQDTILGTGAVATRRFIESCAAAEALSAADTTRWIALSCSFWYEFSLAGFEVRYGFDFDKKAVTMFDEGSTKICTSTWSQCGRAVARLFALPRVRLGEGGEEGLTLERFADKAVYVSSFTISQKEMLESVLRVTGDKVEDWTVTYEASADRVVRGREMMQKGDMMGFGMLLYSRVFYPNGGGDFSEKLANGLLGLPKEDLDAATKEAVRLHEYGVLKSGGDVGALKRWQDGRPN